MREKVKGIRSINCRCKIGEVTNSIENGEAKELTCTTHGHEISGGMLMVGGYKVEGDKVEEKMGQL